MSICGTFWGQNRIDNRQKKIDSSILQRRFGKKNFQGRGRGGLRACGTSWDQKHNLYRPKESEIYSYDSRLLREKIDFKRGRRVRVMEVLELLWYLWDQNHTWLSVKQDEIWLLRSRGPRDASSFKGLQGCNSNRGSTYDVGRAPPGDFWCTFLSTIAYTIELFFDFFPQYQL